MQDKKKIVIGALCALIMIMAVGYALLSQQLSINGSASITSNWQVEITNITEKEKSTGATTNNTNYTATTASFNTSLTSPGDYALYEVTVTNKGTLDAVLAAKPTVTTGNNTAITYELEGIASGDKLPATTNNTKTFTIKVQYNPSTTKQPNNLTSNIEVTLNYEQDLSVSQSGQVDITHEFNGTGTIYRYLTDANSGKIQKLSSNQNIEDYLSNNSYKTEWSKDPSDFNSIHYLKHEVSNNVIIASYVCFIVDNTEHCMQGGDRSYYQTNVGILQGVQSWFTSNNGSCMTDIADESFYCYGDSVNRVEVSYNGYVSFRADGVGCYVYYNGSSYCVR